MTLIVYFGGIIGYLHEVSVVLLVAGGACFIWFIVEKAAKKNMSFGHISLLDGFYLIGTALFIGIVLFSKFQHYDNFSHWSVVVKYMLSADAFPNSSAELIDFSNYPLGTSSWIYYVCSFSSKNQGVMMAAQGILIFACLYSLFGIIKEKRRFLLYAVLATGCCFLSIFNVTIRINNLLVDFVLPVMTLAAWSVIYRYQDEPEKCFSLLVPVLGLLFIVKTTGAIYVAFSLTYWLYIILSKKEQRRIKNAAYLFSTVLVSMVSTLLWRYRVSTVFAEVENKFDFSVQDIGSSLGGKTADEIREIAEAFLHAVCDISSTPTIGYVCFNLAAVFLCICVRHYLKTGWRLEKVLPALNIMVIIYYAGILGMYIFSMPTDEALVLAGFERYASSIIVLFAGGIIMCVTTDAESSFYVKLGTADDRFKSFKSPETKRRYQSSVMAALFVGSILLMSEYNGLAYNKAQYDDSLPRVIETVTGDRWYADGKEDKTRYLFYGSDRDGQMTNYYFTYIARYFMFAPNIDAICAFYEDNLLNLLNNYDYLVIIEPDAEEKQLLKKYFGVDGEAGFYEVTELLRHNNA